MSTTTNPPRKIEARVKQMNDTKAARASEQRNTLFAAGGLEADADKQPEAQLSTDQLVKKAQRTHADTTASARRALKTLEQSKEVQRATMMELHEQSKQIQFIDANIDQMNEDLTYSEKLLRYMRRCCCLSICDSCTGADPEAILKQNWERRVDNGGTQDYEGSSILSGQVGAGSKAKSGQKGEGTSSNHTGFKDPDIRLDEKHGATATSMHTETRKQNEIFEQIGTGLDELLEGARAIGNELRENHVTMDEIGNRTEGTVARVKEMNTNSQLGGMAGGTQKKKKSGMPTDAELAAKALPYLKGL